MLDRLLESKYKIKELLEKDDTFIDSLTSEELFQIVITFSNDNEIRPFIEKNANKILDRCTIDYDMFNCFTIICLKAFKINREQAQICLDRTINKSFGCDSITYLLKLIRMMKKDGVICKEELFKIIINDLNKMSTVN